MPKRPKQHQLEDLSRAKFQLCLPEEWVLRDKDKDYGIDCEVELFDKDENSTGILFYVQLKATGSKKEKEIFNVDFKIETLEYFKQLEIPVLLARYSQHLDKVYIKWVNQVDLTFAKKKAKTFRIKIAETNEWNEDSAKQIENDLKNVRTLKSGSFNFPIGYSINFNDSNIQGLSNNQFKIQLRNKLSEYSDFLEYKRDDQNCLININIEKNILLVQTGILRGVFFHNLDKRPKETFIEELSLDILLSLSMCMVMVGQIDYCGKIIFDNELGKRLIEKEELLLRLLPILLSSSYFENTIKLIDNALDNKENEIILFPSIARLLLESDTKNKKRIALIESFFQSQLDKAKKLKIDGLIATSHYNLGNFYRSKDKHYKSIHNYVSAKKYDLTYLERPYYYREIAGVCFEAGKFKFSSKFYRKALELGASDSTKRLLADALMFAGEYAKSSEVFNEYISESEMPNEEFLLKSLLLNRVVINQNVKSQIRESTKAKSYAAIGELDEKEKQLENLEKALNLDILSSLAWYNFGYLNQSENEFIKAMYCYSMAAIIDLGDIEAWINAFLSFINSGEEGDLLIGSLILKTAYWHNRDEFLIQLYEILEQNSESSTEVIKMIDNILTEDNKTTEKGAVLRILDGKEYKEIELRK
jgi:tetratricopeptide (TPR) repeat protein